MSPHENFQNVATGNASVGFQIGKNTGTVTPSPSPVDLLKAVLDQSPLAGEARIRADREIATARTAIVNGDSGEATRALTRLAGWTEGIAGYGALIGAVISVVQGIAS
ncbi:hypothetical protein ACTI_53510 [Actinoplanes sp. OR16]|uniref:hypothetical protein n=1 Tax=Actinoplanes sp. OR16 TaxID=946334 RepID=UPI000F6BAB95|nr:hypothetical protein [Actinoplanes sp. OR16]BBH68666.1 hypothetical protein ACTI_53510 [Actinoplanes sp. OR16]